MEKEWYFSIAGKNAYDNCRSMDEKINYFYGYLQTVAYYSEECFLKKIAIIMADAMDREGMDYSGWPKILDNPLIPLVENNMLSDKNAVLARYSTNRMLCAIHKRDYKEGFFYENLQTIGSTDFDENLYRMEREIIWLFNTEKEADFAGPYRDEIDEILETEANPPEKCPSTVSKHAVDTYLKTLKENREDILEKADTHINELKRNLYKLQTTAKDLNEQYDYQTKHFLGYSFHGFDELNEKINNNFYRYLFVMTASVFVLLIIHPLALIPGELLLFAYSKKRKKKIIENYKRHLEEDIMELESKLSKEQSLLAETLAKIDYLIKTAND